MQTSPWHQQDARWYWRWRSPNHQITGFDQCGQTIKVTRGIDRGDLVQIDSDLLPEGSKLAGNRTILKRDQLHGGVGQGSCHLSQGD